MSGISTVARRELVELVGARYRSASVDDKRLVLDEFVAITGYHRKYAIRILNTFDAGAPRRHGGRHPLYDEAIRQTLIILWEASDRICGKRLKHVRSIEQEDDVEGQLAQTPRLKRHCRFGLDHSTVPRIWHYCHQPLVLLNPKE